MNALENWSFGDALVRTVRMDEKGIQNVNTLSEENVWFVAKDVASALGYELATNLTRVLDDDETAKCTVATSGGTQEMIVISEAGVYHAAFMSRKENAREFRRWVTGEVLPAIRKTGSFNLSAKPIERENGYAGMAKLLGAVAGLHKQGIIDGADAKAATMGVFEDAGISLLSIKERILEIEGLAGTKTSVQKFIDEMLECGEGATTWNDLYSAYCEWAGLTLDDFGLPTERGALTPRMFTSQMKRAIGITGPNGDSVYIDGKSARGLKNWRVRDLGQKKLPPATGTAAGAGA